MSPPSLEPTSSAARFERIRAVLNRVPWLLPTLSFAAGWIGFVMVRRGEGAARWIAMLALLGWLWLLIEPLLRRRLEKHKPRMGVFVANFVSQSLQQELLFFSLPLLIGATQLETGQFAFTALTGAAALISTIDPVYERYIAKHPAARLAFHAYCSWIAALVVMPMVLRLPLERALPLSLAAVVAWLVLTLPLSLSRLRGPLQKTGWIAGLIALPWLLWQVRSHVPAAGLAVTEARITQSIDGLVAGTPIKVLASAELSRGVIAYAAIRAPNGLAQTVIFRWRHLDQSELIVEEIHGGKRSGWRTYSRKQLFPTDARGKWTVDILTPQGQLLKRLRFSVE